MPVTVDNNAIYSVALAIFGTCVLANPCYSQETTAPPPAVRDLLACRAVPAAEARLACFDAASQGLAEAHEAGDLLIVGQAEAQRARRAAFGFSAPDIAGLLGGGDTLAEIEGPLASAGRTPEGWIFRFEDGSVWRQIDTMALNFRFRPGMTARVRRAAMGSYMLKVGDNPAVRVKRQ